MIPSSLYRQTVTLGMQVATVITAFAQWIFLYINLKFILFSRLIAG